VDTPFLEIVRHHLVIADAQLLEMGCRDPDAPKQARLVGRVEMGVHLLQLEECGPRSWGSGFSCLPPATFIR
jgi:hypothetical protein